MRLARDEAQPFSVINAGGVSLADCWFVELCLAAALVFAPPFVPTAQAQATVPGAPTITGSDFGNGIIILFFEAPEDGGSAITHYERRYKTTGAYPDTWTELIQSAHSTAVAFSHLVNDTVHTFRVRAVNTIGVGAPSLAMSATPTADNTAPTFTDGASTTRRVAENTAAGQNVGAAVGATDTDTSDTLTYTLGGDDASSFAIVSTSGQLQTRAALNHEAMAVYSVTVMVSDGNSGTDSIAVTVNVGDVSEQPNTPAAPAVGATSGSNTSLDVSWTAPGRNGGPAIGGYNLQYRQGNSGGWTNGPQNVSGTSRAITGLTVGTAYQVKVRALNGETPSDWSPAGSGSTSSPGNTVPGAPRNLAASGGDGEVTLNWDPPNTGGTPSSYQYRYTSTGTYPASWTSAGGASVRSVTVPNLTNDTPHTFQVRAVNSVGNGVASVEATATPTPADVAPTPRGVFGCGNGDGWFRAACGGRVGGVQRREPDVYGELVGSGSGDGDGGRRDGDGDAGCSRHGDGIGDGDQQARVWW